MQKTFTFRGAKKLVFGSGSIKTLSDHIAELGAKRPIIFLDGNLSSEAFRQKMSKCCGEAEGNCIIYDGITGEPELKLADEGADLSKKERCDLVIGIGGGSTMDVAKAAAVIAQNGGKAQDYLGLNRVPAPGLPTIMVPTTAGTGSEVTFTAVFIRKDLSKKEGINSIYMYPDVALLDPELTVSVPPSVTAATGLDALCHAIESYTSIISSPMSEMISMEAIGLISDNLRTCVNDGKNVEARSNMLLGSMYAGLGLANAGVTAVHSLSYPLGGQYGISHGIANTVLLAPTMRFNVSGAVEKFARIAANMGKSTEGITQQDAAAMAVEAVEELIRDCGIDTSLEKLGITREVFHKLAEAAMMVARPLENNPRTVTIEDAVAIYEDAY
ncbi:MAG: iron-containing alcohol dehydrogenase [Deltaproteobacteria bacterium]|nr:iron-containing alcohol dehydrogenase [Deltaproteobacteria bacterium]